MSSRCNRSGERQLGSSGRRQRERRRPRDAHGEPVLPRHGGGGRQAKASSARAAPGDVLRRRCWWRGGGGAPVQVLRGRVPEAVPVRRGCAAPDPDGAPRWRNCGACGRDCAAGTPCTYGMCRGHRTHTSTRVVPLQLRQRSYLNYFRLTAR